MNGEETLTALMVWSPFLLGGFAWNVFIAFLALLIGTAVGGGLALARISQNRRLHRSATLLSGFFRNIPTIAFMFYTTTMLPNEFIWPATGEVYAVPGWIKAALALSAAQIGFSSDQLGNAVLAWRGRQYGTALLFIPNWVNGFVITVLASTSSSLVGVGELVSRCNTVINASGNSDLMIPVYLYASLIFMSFCIPVSLMMQKFRKTLRQRLDADAKP